MSAVPLELLPFVILALAAVNFVHLQQELANTEEKIAYAPGNVWARWFHLEPAVPFAVEAASQDVTVSFTAA